MKIKDILLESKRIKLKKPIVVTFGVIDEVKSYFVKIITDDGICGYGEASGIAYLTGEFYDTIPIVIKNLSSQLIGVNPLEIANIHRIMDNICIGNTASKAAIDMALYDIYGKALEAPLYKLIGAAKSEFFTDITIPIGSVEESVEYAIEKVNYGFKELKIKVGLNLDNDIEVIRAIREAVGYDICMRIDANQGWDVPTTLIAMEKIKKYKIDAIEQPLPYWDIDGSRIIRQKSDCIKIILDEGVHSPYDAMRAIKSEAVDIINIKLMKSGGIFKALQINTIAKNAGIKCMVGCMAETDIGASASAHLIASQKNIEYADCDSSFLYDSDDIKSGFIFENGKLIIKDKPGLGIDVNW